MGSPKALLEDAGVPFLAGIIDALTAGGCDQVITVLGGEDQPGNSRMKEIARAHGSLIVSNPDPDSEQLDSVRLALGSVTVQPDLVLITPVDAPGVDMSTIIATIKEHTGGVVITVPSFEGRRGHPIAFSGPALEDLRSAELAEGARSVIKRYSDQMREVRVDDPAILNDVDTPADYAEMRKGTE